MTTRPRARTPPPGPRPRRGGLPVPLPIQPDEQGVAEGLRSACESIRVSEQEVAERLKADAPAVEALMTRWIVPHSQIVVASTPRAGGEPLCSRSQVVATVGIASHDGAEVASWFSPQAARIDELEWRCPPPAGR